MRQNRARVLILQFFLFCGSYFCLDPFYEACKPKDCGNGQNVSYPFFLRGHQEPYCGYPGFELNCSDNGYPTIHIPDNDFIVDGINYTDRSLRIRNAADSGPDRGCFRGIENTTIDGQQFRLADNSSFVALLSDCGKLPDSLRAYGVACGGGAPGLAVPGGDANLTYGEELCGREVVVPVERSGGESPVGEGYWEVVRRGFLLNWTAGDCTPCESRGGRCGFNSTTDRLVCFCPDRPHLWRCRHRKRSNKRLIILAVVVPGSALFLVLCSVVFIILRRSNVSSCLTKKAALELEESSVYLGVPIFPYKELVDATQNFDPAKELGDGGYGTVYHGKLRDGREVAVKSLYEHNYRRVEQFMNEVKILTRLRHPNLVSLYGCTSHRSHELLLVYEYVPNGTLADNLYGDLAKRNSLTWRIRMNAAVEIAAALAYLHASDIIHRDVKTTNILLDENFHVKVADFGLSRLFPTNASHISTAPQGTPGYVDPDYYQCYQLTGKSDVYSFGVVLVELISSMPAVDITRHRHEINLSNFAINKIQKGALHELIDAGLGFESDEEVKRTATSVAELAFWCLQYEKEARPTMNEVLEVLKEIQGEEKREETDRAGKLRPDMPPPSPEFEDAMLLKGADAERPSLPNSAADKWFSSRSTISSSSG